MSLGPLVFPSAGCLLLALFLAAGMWLTRSDGRRTATLRAEPDRAG